MPADESDVSPIIFSFHLIPSCTEKMSSASVNNVFKRLSAIFRTIFLGFHPVPGSGVTRKGQMLSKGNKPRSFMFVVGTARFFVFVFLHFQVHMLYCFFVFSRQYHCTSLPPNTYLWIHLLCVELNVKTLLTKLKLNSMFRLMSYHWSKSPPWQSHFQYDLQCV